LGELGHADLPVLGGSNAADSVPGICRSAGGYSQVVSVVILCGDVMENLVMLRGSFSMN
jgi:hypothetical protein